jgi:GDP-L-fucose synthase
MNLNKYSKFFNNKKILITGGTGLIGKSLADQLLSLGAKITINSLDRIRIKKDFKYIKGDLTNFNFCKKITKKIDFVFHLAGIKGSVKMTKEKPASFFVPLLMMNTNFLEACRINKVKRLVYTSSIGAYSPRNIFKETNNNFKDEPMDLFPGWAKRMAELQILAYKKQYNLRNYFVVRPCNVYGPGDNFDHKNAMFIPSLLRKIFLKKFPVEIWGDGKAIRDFAYSEDVAKGIILTMIYGTGNYNYLNLGGGKSYSIRDVVDIASQNIKFKYFFNKKNEAGYSKRIMSITNAEKITGYKPEVSLKDGIIKDCTADIKIFSASLEKNS